MNWKQQSTVSLLVGHGASATKLLVAVDTTGLQALGVSHVEAVASVSCLALQKHGENEVRNSYWLRLDPL